MSRASKGNAQHMKMSPPSPKVIFITARQTRYRRGSAVCLPVYVYSSTFVCIIWLFPFEQPGNIAFKSGGQQTTIKVGFDKGTASLSQLFNIIRVRTQIEDR